MINTVTEIKVSSSKLDAKKEVVCVIMFKIKNNVLSPSSSSMKWLLALPLFFWLAASFYRSSSWVEVLQGREDTISGTTATGPAFLLGFNDDLIPWNSTLDMNIGTNFDPMGPKEGRHRILVDPLFAVCESNAKLTEAVTAFCFAVSNYTGFATFNEYNRGGVSSSLSKVSKGTSHQRFEIVTKRTVLVLEAMVLFSAIHQRQSTIHRLKMDMQGHELTTFQNIQGLLKDTNLVTHIKAECFCPNSEGKQIYDVDNSCQKISDILQDAGYETLWQCEGEHTDVYAFKKGLASDFIPPSDYGS